VSVEVFLYEVSYALYEGFFFGVFGFHFILWLGCVRSYVIEELGDLVEGLWVLDLGFCA